MTVISALPKDLIDSLAFGHQQPEDLVGEMTRSSNSPRI